MKKLKILLISESPLEYDGEKYYAVDPWIKFPIHLANNCQLTILSPVKTITLAEKIKESWQLPKNNLTIFGIDFYNSFASFYKLLLFKHSLWKEQISQLVSSHDLVLIRIPSPMLNIAVGASIKNNKPYILLVAGDTLAQSDKILKSTGLKKWFYTLIIKKFVKYEIKAGINAAAIYAYSSELEEKYAFAKNKVRRLRTPHLSLNDFKYREDTCQRETVKLLRVAWLLPSKGYVYLIKAIDILLKNGLNVELHILGHEREEGYELILKNLVNELGIHSKIFFHGWIPHDKIEPFYLDADIQVISSLSEGTPRCIIEGFSVGLPLVSTTAGGCKDILEDHKTALLVQPQRADSLAEAIKEIIINGQLRRNMISNGYELAKEGTFEKMGIRFLNELTEIAAKN